MRATGQIFLWGGFLGAAFCSVLRLAPTIEPTPDQPPNMAQQIAPDTATTESPTTAPPQNAAPNDSDPTILSQTMPSDWATVPWVWYGTSMLLGVVGVLILRKENKRDHHDDTKTEAEYSVVQGSLATVADVIRRLCDMPEMNPSFVLRAIDDECAEPLSEFADARQSLIKRFGMKTYADIMTEFASAERFINRAWSASADGYVDEVKSCLQRANRHLSNAKQQLDAAEDELEQEA